MHVDRIVCLANSYKHDHRCVAGITLNAKKWVRLVGNAVPGCLTTQEICYPDGSEPTILDVFEAEIDSPCATRAHPEDIRIGKSPWRPIRRFDQPPDLRFLADFVAKGPGVMEGYGDRVFAQQFESAQAERSLDLVRPEDLWWWVRDEGGRRKNRTLFRVGRGIRTRYDLAVTDPRWLERLRHLPAGIYPHSSFFAGQPPTVLLTVSLSEPFEKFHYKLVAGVVNLPA